MVRENSPQNRIWPGGSANFEVTNMIQINAECLEMHDVRALLVTGYTSGESRGRGVGARTLACTLMCATEESNMNSASDQNLGTTRYSGTQSTMADVLVSGTSAAPDIKGYGVCRM